MASVLSTLAATLRNSIPALRDTAHALAVARERLAAIDAEIAAIDRLPPSRDEIVSLYTRHVDEDSFVADFRRNYLNEHTLAAMTGTELAAHSGAHVLVVGHLAPSQRSLITHPAYSPKLNEPVAGESDAQQSARLRQVAAMTTVAPPAPNMRALEFVLAPLLRQRVAELVDAALPDGYKGITAAERAAKIAKLQKERTSFESDVADLESALKQMGVTVAAPTKTGSDVEQLTARQRAEKIVAAQFDNIIGMSPDEAIDKVEAALQTGRDVNEALS